MPGCCVSRCTNRSEKGFKLYRWRHSWLQLIGRSELAPNSRICEVHFSNNQFGSKRSDNRKLLRSDAIPDLLATHKVGCESVTEESTLPEANNLEEASYSKRIRLNTSYRNDHDYFSVNEVYDNEMEPNNSIVCDKDTDHFVYGEDVESNKAPAIKIAKLKKTLRQAWQKCNSYKQQLTRKIENYDKVFNDDQLQYLSSGSHRGVKWSDDTMAKALKLYMACGENGYEELRKQNLPYPSIRTIQHRLRNLKFQSDG